MTLLMDPNIRRENLLSWIQLINSIISLSAIIIQIGEVLGPNLIAQPSPPEINPFQSPLYQILVMLSDFCVHCSYMIEAIEMYLEYYSSMSLQYDYINLIIQIFIKHYLPYFFCNLIAIVIHLTDDNDIVNSLLLANFHFKNNAQIKLVGIVEAEIALLFISATILYIQCNIKYCIFQLLAAVSFLFKLADVLFFKTENYFINSIYCVLGFSFISLLYGYDIQKMKMKNAYVEQREGLLFKFYNFVVQKSLIFSFLSAVLIVIFMVRSIDVSNRVNYVALYFLVDSAFQYCVYISLYKIEKYQLGLNERVKAINQKFLPVQKNLKIVSSIICCYLNKFLSQIQIGPYNVTMLFILYSGSLGLILFVDMLLTNFLQPLSTTVSTKVQGYYQQQKHDHIAHIILKQSKQKVFVNQ